MDLEEALNTPVSIDETSMAGTYRGEIQDDAFVDETPNAFDDAMALIDEMENTAAPGGQAKSEPVDTVDYTTDKPFIKLNSRSLLRILSQISPIINENSNRAVSKGITLRVVSNDSVEVISPNELYYFKAVLSCETTLEVGEIIFLEYRFLQKMARFIPQQTLIYKDVNKDGMDIYYIRMINDDLELINTQLIDSDKKKLDYAYNVTEEIKVLEPAKLLSSLSTLSRVVSFESDSNRKEINIVDGRAVFKSALVHARSLTDLNNMALKIKNIQYIIKTIGLLNQGENIVIKNTDSEQYTRYAICTDNSVMIANYSDGVEDLRIKDLFDNPPTMTLIDYGKLKYQLDYANAITYAMGNVNFEVKDGKLNGQIKLNNGNSSPLDIPLLGDIPLADGTTFKVNTKTFLNSLNSLDPTLETSIGYKDGYVYLSNANVTLILLSI